MRTELRLPDVPVQPGDVTIIEIEVANTSDVIDGITARVEGIDPSWVHFPTPVLSLFPESTGTLPVHVRFPPSTVVGDYLVVINVESTIDPTRRSTHDLWLRVDPIEAASMRLRPSVVTKGKRATFAALVTNEGNVITNYTMTAVDETRVLDCSAEPLTLPVHPGEEGVAEIDVRGPRPWFGQPVARTVTIGAESAGVTLREVATFNQRPRIPRGLLTLALLGGIVALWAAIFLVGVDLLRQGDDPAKAVAENFNSTGDTQGVQNVPLAAVAGSMLGKVTAQSTGDGLALITVEAYRVTSTGEPELTGSAGTAEDGTYTLASLIPGTYVLRFTAVGYDELWYPASPTAEGASEIPLKPTAEAEGLDVAMVGQPGGLVGTVELPDSATPGQLITVAVTELPEQPTDENVPAPPPPPPPVIQETPGPVEFAGLVTPAHYRIRVSAAGFEPQEFEQALEGGETRVLNTVRLGAATGSIAGTVFSSSGEPLGNVKVAVTSGDIEREATTPTAGNVGTFLVDGLDTPRTYILTFTLEGFSGQTIALDLAAGANRTGVNATLTGGTGTITGLATDMAGQPLGGVEVTVTRGEFTADTKTLTTSGPGAGVGGYTVSDLPTPGTFAVTFSLEGYVPETRSVGFMVPGVQSDISVAMRRADASVVGTVSGGGQPIVGASVELSDGLTSRTTATASTPNGGYTFTGVPPGSYTLTVQAPGFARQIVLIQVAAGDALVRDVALGAAPLMHVTALPMLVELPVGQPAQVAVTITNTSAIIDAYSVRAFGLDPQWLRVDQPRLSLFPSEVGLVEVTVTLPPDFPAGMRTVAVHVQSENDPTEFSLAQVTLDVGTRVRTSLRIDPVTVTGGNAAAFSLILANDGNATVQARPQGVDPEDVVDIDFEPPTVVLSPGRREVVRADVHGGRPWFGQPKPRVLTFSLGGDSPPAMATFVQRPRIGRWLISLLGLVTVAGIFALVLSEVADRLVDEAAVDDELLNEALTQPGAGGGEAVSVTPSAVTGKVVVVSTGDGVAGVQVELYSSGNGVVAMASAATDGSGAYTFGRLPAGRYRLRFTGAGFDEQWYKASQTFADATDVEVAVSATVQLEDLELGGRPGSIAGEVIVADPTGAVARLVVPGAADENTDALVEEVAVSADGAFLFEEVPSPATYQLIVDKEGFATEVRDVVLRAAQDLEGIEVVMREGDGVVSGRVDSPSGPLGGVAVQATGGDVEVSTVSLTVDDVGSFAVRTLPTPGQYTLTFERDGYDSATRTVNLTAGQQLSGLAVTLAPTTGAISGIVSLGDQGPVGGVTVTVTGPDVELSTTTASVGAPGSYVFDSLPIPATYTITFTKPGLVSQTRLEDLDPLAGRGTIGGIDARMVSSTATVRGTVRSAAGSAVAGAAVELNDGSEVREVQSADDPLGRFEFAGVEPGAYTLTATLPGTSPAVLLVNVIAAEVVDLAVNLEPQASLFGRVLVLDPASGQFVPYAPCPATPTGTPCGAVVRLFAAEDFPGLPSQALGTVATDVNGGYTFGSLEAPDDFVVSVYATPTAGDALDSVLVQTQPSVAAEVPTFQIRQVT